MTYLFHMGRTIACTISSVKFPNRVPRFAMLQASFILQFLNKALHSTVIFKKVRAFSSLCVANL